MEKKFSKFIVFFVMSIMLVLTPFSLQLLGLNNANATPSTIAETPSIFIRKPTYSTIYDNKVYFVDDYDNLLKIYNITTSNFEQIYVSLSNYDEIVDVVSLNENLFAVVKKVDSYYIIKIELNTLTIKELLVENISEFHNQIYVSTTTINDAIHYIVSITPSKIEENVNPIVLFIEKQNFTISHNNTIIFDTSKSTDTLSIKQSLIKFFTYPSSRIDEINLIFFYGSNIAYANISIEKITSSQINITTVTPFNYKLDTTDTDIKINDINTINIDNLLYFVVTYLVENDTISISRLYSYNIGDSSDTFFTYKTYTESAITNFTTTNNDYILYPDDQTIVCKKITFDSTNNIYSSVENEISNPNFTINYMLEDNFIYKQSNKTTALYATPWDSEPIIDIESASDLIQIGTATIDSANITINDYCYCLYTSNNINYTGFIKTSDINNKEIISIEDYNYSKFVTVYDKTPLYSLPTKVIDGVAITTELIPTTLFLIKKYTKVELIDTICKYTANSSTLVKVKVNDTYGYIDCKDIIEPNTSVEFIITNSAIKKNGTKVYSDTSTNSQVKDILNKNKMVRIDGSRDTKSGFTHITYNDEYGNVLSGYIVTDYIESDSWSTLQIIGCILIAINIGLLILILIFKKEHIGNRGQKYLKSKKANYKEHEHEKME